MKHIAIVLITMILYTVIMDTVFVICVDQCNDHRHAHLSLNHELSHKSSGTESGVTQIEKVSHFHCVDYSLISDAVTPHSLQSLLNLLCLVALIFIMLSFYSPLVRYILPKRVPPPRLLWGIRTTIIQV